MDANAKYSAFFGVACNFEPEHKPWQVNACMKAFYYGFPWKDRVRTRIGFGVSHRSGIFGSSQLLGNFNGGSNYIYTYIESRF